MARALHFMLLIALVSLPGADSAGAELPRVELSTGIGWPRSGALRRYWGAGPNVGLHRLLAAPRGAFTTCGLRYNYFDYSSESGYGTHGLRASLALHGRPSVASLIDAQVGAGIGGLWTSSPASSGCEEILTASPIGEPRRQIGKIHGWGPTLEAGVGVVFLEDEPTGGRATLRALWTRTWASDTFLDQLTVEMAWGLR